MVYSLTSSPGPRSYSVPQVPFFSFGFRWVRWECSSPEADKQKLLVWEATMAGCTPLDFKQLNPSDQTTAMDGAHAFVPAASAHRVTRIHTTENYRTYSLASKKRQAQYLMPQFLSSTNLQ